MPVEKGRCVQAALAANKSTANNVLTVTQRAERMVCGPGNFTTAEPGAPVIRIET